MARTPFTISTKTREDSFWINKKKVLESWPGHESGTVMHKTIFVINIILHMCLQHSNTL